MSTRCLLTALLLSTPACTGPDPARAATNKAAPEPTNAAAPVEAPPLTPPVATPVAPPARDVPAADAIAVAPPEPAAVTPPTAEATAPVVPGEAPTIAIQPITAVPTTVTWREVIRPGEALTFVPLIRGVLAKSAGGYSDVDASGALVLRPEIEAPPFPILGVWPDNAWYVETRTRIAPGDRSMIEIKDMRLMRLRGKKRWVPQAYNGEQRFSDEGQQVQIGGSSGLIVSHNGTLTRLADNGVDPVLGLDRGGTLAAMFETHAGEVYTVRQQDDVLYAQRDCADPECVNREATKLPLGVQWSFTQRVTRQQHSISAVAEARVDDNVQAHLLHYEAGGWKLEAIASAPVGLWPTKDGGLWTMVGAQLLNRDPKGGWREVALPEGATSVTAAMRGDLSELWIAATVGDAAVVFATTATAQTPAPAPAAP